MVADVQGVESQREKCIGKYLNDNNILHEAQYRFKDCRNKKQLPFDFAIFDNDGNLTMLIEYDGELHYQSIEHFGGDEKIHQQIENDQIKNQYCRDNNIKLYRIPYWKFNEIEEILDKLIHNKPIEVDETSFSIL